MRNIIQKTSSLYTLIAISMSNDTTTNDQIQQKEGVAECEARMLSCYTGVRRRCKKLSEDSSL